MKYCEVAFPVILEKMSQEKFRAIFLFANFLISLMFCIRSGLYVFNEFDNYSCSIQLLLTFLLQLWLVPWYFGLEKLEVLMQERTGEKFPIFIKFCAKFFIPAFVFLIFIITWINEFKYSEDKSKNLGLYWLLRLMMLLPCILYPIGWFKRIPTDNIYDIIKKDYGITFNADGTH